MPKYLLLVFVWLCSGVQVMAQQNRKINPVAKQQYDTGNKLLNQGKNKDAINWFNKALQTDPAFTECHMGLGVAYSNSGQLQTANKHLTAVLQKFPKDYEAFLLRALNYYDLGDTARALADIHAAVNCKPDFAKAYYNRAVMIANAGNHLLALTDINTAIALEPKNAEYHFQRALLYEQLNNLRLAMADYDTVIILNPRLYDMKAYNNRAQCKKFFKDIPGAIADYTEILKANPGNTVVLINRAFAKLSIKDGEGACEDFRLAQGLGNAAAAGFLNKYCKGLYD